jgi:DNA-binding NarL/FixJ family response regulator
MLAQTDISIDRVPSDPAIVRFLVVDDHPFFREGLITWIARQRNFISCGHADSPVTALQAIARHHPNIVLLDLQLRDGDGFDLLRLLKESEHQPRVIVVSHKDETVFAERAIRAGARGYVLKDEAIDVMLVAIQDVLDGGIHLSDAMRRHLAQSDSTALTGPIGRLRSLYNRELQVLQLLGRGRTTKEIAQELCISPKTVEFYRENLKRKLGVSDSLSLVRLATIWEHDQRLIQ